jgi:hypothetical protein
LPILRLAGPWIRFHLSAYDPLFFGRMGANRFDDPLRRYGVLYAAETGDGAFIETFGRSPGLNVVSHHQLLVRSVALIDATRQLRLVDLTGPGLAHIGATGSLTSGSHEVAQVWSRALWEHPSRPDGLLFRARHDPSCLSVAIFSRATRAVRATPQGGLLDIPALPLVVAALRRYNFVLRP